MRNFGFWIKLCLFNFFLVSVLGVLMRYNRVFSLNGMDHKFMQESHSHFAFYGWVSALIYLFVFQYLKKNNAEISTRKYHIVMVFNQVGSYGMLISFLYGGYYWLSIVFSSIALFTSFLYILFLFLDSRGNNNSEIIWLKSGAIFAAISAIGIFGLAYYSSRKEDYSELYRSFTYLYLHYQYNGFFLFSCIGLLLISLKKYGVELSKKQNKVIYYLLLIGCFFGYGLSILWIEMFDFLNVFFAIVSLIQLYGAWRLCSWVGKQRRGFMRDFSFIQKVLLWVVGFSFLLKFILQSISAIPNLGVYIFNNINLVIAYLHLVLLMGVSLFLIWNIIEVVNLKINKVLTFILLSLIFGIVLNEMILGLVGVFSIFYIPFMSSAYWLLVASVIIMLSILIFLLKIEFNESEIINSRK